MAILELNFKSVCLAMQTSVTVILPETDALYHGSIPKYKTLYILHGLSNNHTTYVRNTNIERYATEKGLAVIIQQQIIASTLTWFTVATFLSLLAPNCRTS